MEAGGGALFVGEDLRHPNIVACLGFECTKDSFYIYLEYVPWQKIRTLQILDLGVFFVNFSV